MLFWYVAQTEPFKGILAEQLLAADGFEVFHPKVRKTYEWSRGRTRTMVHPYIAGYLFVRFDVAVHVWEDINITRGVKTLMYSTSETPARISDRAMEPLRNICGPDGFLIEEEADEVLFALGQTVNIVAGPFLGSKGKVIDITLQRLKVLTSVFGRDTEVRGKVGMFAAAPA